MDPALQSPVLLDLHQDKLPHPYHGSCRNAREEGMGIQREIRHAGTSLPGLLDLGHMPIAHIVTLTGILLGNKEMDKDVRSEILVCLLNSSRAYHL